MPMPIRREVRHYYGKEWRKTIRPAILRRSEVDHDRFGLGVVERVSRCECTGQCSAHEGRCVEIDRTLARTFNGAGGLKRRGRSTDPIEVIITIAHLDQDPANMDYANLMAACQQCHNRIDAPYRHHHAWRTKRRRKREAQTAAGQLDLFPG